LDELGNIVRNKASQWPKITIKSEIDFEEAFAPVARLEAIRMTLAFVSFKDFQLYQMNVKSAFLNGYIEMRCMLNNHPEFVDPIHSDHVFKLERALYGLKQAPKA